ncbi:MAG: nickel pincer cofactor biosynthesis protein LarC [Candidatus Binatia bacterium]|nr:nickel pincer cofactor biosynthesis protein LarC [Candidatus Binatia bacterium]
MRVAYFDTFSGVSGDMTIGAFLDLGMPLSVLEEGLAPLGLADVTLDVGHRVRSGIQATKFTVHAPGLHEHGHHHDDHSHDHHHTHRSYGDIRELLTKSALTPRVRERAEKVFHVLAVAEARIHAMPLEDVGFHEVGAIDAIVDIVGAAICLEHFGIDRIHSSPLPLGSGMTRSQHGVIPVPAPATVEILRGFPTRLEDGTAELVTPTGAAIIAALARPEPPPVLAPIASGYGAGDREMPDRPNLLRIILADTVPDAAPSAVAPGMDLERDEMMVLEANIDDMNPELFEPAMEALFEGGARDVSLAPITMKRGRPGTLIRVIASPSDGDALGRILLRETSTIGVRTHPVSRLMLPRENRTVSTRFGAINVKVVQVPGGDERITPEYADCHRAGREHGVPVATVYEETLRAAWDKGS